MQIPYILLQVILVPIAAAIISIPLGRKYGPKAGWLAVGALSYTTLLLLYVGFNLYAGQPPVSEVYSWSTVNFNLSFGFLADGLGLPVALILNLVCTASAAFSVRYMQRRIEVLYGKGRNGMHALYYSIYLLFAVGLVGVALATNLIELYLFVELTLIPSYIMIDLFGYVDRHRIAMMYFIWNHVGAALFLIGIVLGAVGSGSFNISGLASLSGTPLGLVVCSLILIGWLVKMAAFGFHVWLPYAHGEHPTSIAAIIATIVGLGSYVIVRLLFGELSATFALFSLPLMVWATVTLVYGAYLTMAQDDVKRLYACSTIGQTALSVLGIASMVQLGVVGGVFYFLSHVIGKCILFSVAGILTTQTGVRSMKQMGGLAKRMPLTATLCVIGSMILSAMPPLSGFPAEWIMFVGIFTKGASGDLPFLIIGIVAIFGTFLTAVYTFWSFIRIFFGPLHQEMENVKEAPLSMIVPLFILAAASLFMGLFPDIIMRLLTAII